VRNGTGSLHLPLPQGRSNESYALSGSMRQNAVLRVRNSIRTLLKQHVGGLTLLNRPQSLVSSRASCCRSAVQKRPLLTSSQNWNQEIDHREDSVRDATIYALSTAPGRAGIAVVRISGPSCVDVLAPI
jgi:hypothetical protein